MSTQPIPILVLSDSVDAASGLARISRDLCTLLASDPRWRVASLGFGGIGSSRLPWQQYVMSVEEFGERSLPLAWEDHTRGELGILFTIYDLTRLVWLAKPDTHPPIAEWLDDARRKRMSVWSYIPIDATGPEDRLGVMSQAVLLGLDRLLAYSPWGEQVIRRTISDVEANRRGLTWMPHGLGETFKRMDGTFAGRTIGCVMTNQSRKDWGFTARLCSEIVRSHPDLTFWWHVDMIERYWNLEALIADFGLSGKVMITQPPVSDQWLAEMYSKCALTILPSLGEGFGYPIFESYACGTSCFHTDYAGGASIMRTCGLDKYLVEPRDTLRLEGRHNCYRPMTERDPWLYAIGHELEDSAPAHWLTPHVDHLKWKNITGRWLNWFREGLS